MEVAKVFEEVWNLPNCVGAIVSKHVILQPPIYSGIAFINYKSQFSMVLLAAVDGNYNFIFAEAGYQGRIPDGGVFKDTKYHNKKIQITVWHYLLQKNFLDAK